MNDRYPDKISKEDLDLLGYKPFDIFNLSTKYLCNPKGEVYSAYLYNQCPVSPIWSDNRRSKIKLVTFEHIAPNSYIDVRIKDIVMKLFGKPLNDLFSGVVYNKNGKYNDNRIENLVWQILGIKTHITLSEDVSICDKTESLFTKWSECEYDINSTGFKCE